MANPKRNNKTRRAAKPFNVSRLESPIDQIKKEPDLAYRCFLLWAMQDPGRRSARAAARAISRSDGVMRQWKARWSWVSRVEMVSMPDMTAMAIYRAKYYPIYKLREIIEVEGRLAAPFLPNTPIPNSIAEEVEKAVMPDKTTHDANLRKKKIKERHLQLVDGALGLLARKIAAGEIRCAMRDLPSLMKLRDELIEPTGVAVGNQILVESVRIKMAKAQGHDLLEAMHDDAREVVAILGALVTANRLKDKHVLLMEGKAVEL